MSESFFWVDKHAPETITEFVGNGPVIKEVFVWAQAWKRGEKQKPLLLVGGPGTGKTTIAYLLAKDFGWHVNETNASTTRTRDAVERLVGGSSGTASFSGGLRLILIDELDGLSGMSDKGGVTALASILKKPESPIILTANDPYDKSLYEVRGLCKVVKFNTITYLSITKRLREIAAREKIDCPQEFLEAIAKKSGGDLRSAIIDLQNLSVDGKVLQKDLDLLGGRDEAESIFEVLKQIFGAKTFAEARHASELRESKIDLRELLFWISENIPTAYPYPFDRAKAFDSLSKADVFEGRANRKKNYSLWPYAFDLATAGVGMAKMEEYKHYAPYNRPGRFYKSKPDQVSVKVGEACHVSSYVAAQQYVPIIKLIAGNDEEMFTEISAQLDLSEEEIDSLGSKHAKKVFTDAQMIRSKTIFKQSKLSSVLFTSSEAGKKAKDSTPQKNLSQFLS